MSLDRWFRLSSTVTLGLSCSALVFAEDPFLPDLPICLLPVLALLLFAWWVNGRWRLPHWVANILGILIAAAGIVWLVRQYTDEESLLARLPLQLAMLPYMGPLLMAALLVKVFGSRVVSEFWTLQGLGLMQICLGCVLDGGPVFGTLLVLYVASGLTCLALRYRLYSDRREEEVDAHRQSVNERSASLSSFSVRWLLPFMLRWTLLIAVPALALFLLTPRSDSNAWEPLSSLGGSRTAGGSEEINLNGTGRIHLDDEIALQVSAVDAAGQPKLDLPAEQRWRGVVLDSYENGKWTPLRLNPRSPYRQSVLPDFGPQQFFLDYKVPARQSGVLVLAEPVRFEPQSGLLPVVTHRDEGRPPLFYAMLGSVLPRLTRTEREYHYRQVVPGGPHPDRLPAPGVSLQLYGNRLRVLPSQLQQTLRSWTVELLGRLSQDARYDLPEHVRDALAQPQEDFAIKRGDWEATALILTDYLAHSGEYTYSLELSRRNLTLDPVVDFLCNVKEGHCERYASALTLMLRSVGIPARVVKGFRGCESLGDGQYVIRHHHAHAWVEILVRHPGSREEPRMPPLQPFRFRGRLGGRGFDPPTNEVFYDWLFLDPTPTQDASSTTTVFSFDHFWEDIQRLGRQGWESLIVGYSAEEQADLWDMLKPGRSEAALRKLSLAAPAVLVVFCAGLIFSRWRRRRTRADATASKTASFYSRLVSILSRYASFQPISGQTPLEYGEAARAFLRTRAALGTLAELPVRVVDRFYQVRFGARSLSGAERQALDAELAHFAEVVRQEKPSAQTELSS
jgi:transglutaminase-like putative cysteine protease